MFPAPPPYLYHVVSVWSDLIHFLWLSIILKSPISIFKHMRDFTGFTFALRLFLPYFFSLACVFSNFIA